MPATPVISQTASGIGRHCQYSSSRRLNIAETDTSGRCIYPKGKHGFRAPRFTRPDGVIYDSKRVASLLPDSLAETRC